MAKKKMKPLSEEQLNEIDRGDHLFQQLHAGTQLYEPEVALEVDVIRDALWDVLGRMSDYWYEKDKEGTDRLFNLARYAFHYRQLLTIHDADLKGNEIDPDERERWIAPTRSPEWQAILDRYRTGPSEGEAVH